MTTVEFLKSKGLLEKATEYLLEEEDEDYLKWVIDDDMDVSIWFTWVDTKEGIDFWNDVCSEYYSK
jgi:hypothetical protein